MHPAFPLRAGDVADCIFYFQKGQAQIKVVSQQGKEAVIAVVEPGDFCGEGCLITSRCACQRSRP